MNIIQDLIPKGRRNRTGYEMKPEYITVHDTANTRKGADALAHARYLKSDFAANAPVSWHFTVDDKQIVQHLPLDENGWHAGDGAEGPGNRTSIGVEICENADGDRAKAEENAAELVGWLLEKFGLSIERVVQHHHWSGKNCPRILRSRSGGWEAFLKAVEAYMPRRQEEQLTPIMGQPKAIREQAREWLRQKAPDWVLMADLYYSIAPKYGIRADVALCQACKETGFFRFGGLVRPEQNNFCGLGATGPGNPGHSFQDRATGVEAHIQHLYAYATKDPLPEDVEKVDPRFNLVRRGTAPFVEYLGAAENPAGVGWAYPGKDYGHSIVRDYLAKLLAVQVPERDGQLQFLKSENEQLKKQLEAALAENNQLKDIIKKVYRVVKLQMMDI